MTVTFMWTAVLLTQALPGPAAGFIPPRAAEKAGIPAETLRRVDDLTFEANGALIPLDAELRKAQLALDRELRLETPDESKVGPLIDAISRAEAALRKNRVGLLLKIRKVVGPEAWRKLEAQRPERDPRAGPGDLPQPLPRRGGE